jgi:hypothetical protein
MSAPMKANEIDRARKLIEEARAAATIIERRSPGMFPELFRDLADCVERLLHNAKS